MASPFEDPDEQDTPYSMFQQRGALASDQQGPYAPPILEAPETERKLSANSMPVDQGIDDVSAYGSPVAPTLLDAKPYASHAADYAAMTKQKAGEDPSKFKPSGWRRALAGVAGGMVAYGSKNANAGMQVGQNVLNAPLNRAKAQWASQEAPLQANITAGQAEDKQTDSANRVIEQQNRTAEANYRNQAFAQQAGAHAQDFAAQAEARRNAITGFTPDDPKNPYAGGTGITADGRTMKNVAPPDKWLTNWERDPRNKAAAEANQGVATLKALEDSGVKLTPEQRAIVASGGKITPSVHTNINIRENPDGSAYVPPGRGGAQVNPAAADAIVQAHLNQKQAWANQFTRKPDGSYRNNTTFAPMSADEFKAQTEKFRTDANVKLSKMGYAIDPQGQVQQLQGSPRSWQAPGQQAPPQATPQQAPAQQAPSAAPQQTATFSPREIQPGWKLPTGEAWVKKPDGSIGHIPQANLQKAVARGYLALGGQ